MADKKIGKYDRDNLSFNDPAVRCCECHSLILRTVISTEGGCPKCGNKRVRNVLTMSEDEMKRIKDKVDPEWIALFEGVEEDGVI